MEYVRIAVRMYRLPLQDPHCPHITKYGYVPVLRIQTIYFPDFYVKVTSIK